MKKNDLEAGRIGKKQQQQEQKKKSYNLINTNSDEISWISAGPDPLKPPPGYAPLVPVMRAGHLEHIPASLHPNIEVTDIVPRDILEKSSSSFLKDEPPSEKSDDEPGTVGFHCFCFGKKKHHVDQIFDDVLEKDRFGSVLLFFVILSYMPIVGFQIAYQIEDKLRHALLIHHYYTISTLIFLMCIALVLKYLAGLARHFPVHILLILIKSLCHAGLLLTAAAVSEFLMICFRTRLDIRYNDAILTPENGITWEMLFEEYLKNEWDPNDNPYELVHFNPMFIFAAGVVYGFLLLIIMFCLIVCSKVSFFGPTYAFISYTMTFILILISTTLTLSGLGEDDGGSKSRHTLLWDITQSILAGFMGCILAETFVEFLDKLFSGRLCPLKPGEFFYAVAHY